MLTLQPVSAGARLFFFCSLVLFFVCIFLFLYIFCFAKSKATCSRCFFRANVVDEPYMFFDVFWLKCLEHQHFMSLEKLQACPIRVKTALKVMLPTLEDVLKTTSAIRVAENFPSSGPLGC